MNDELVYALLSLALYWGLGWKAGQKLRRYGGRRWDGEDEVGALLGAFFFGAFFWVVAALVIHFKTKGSLFGKEDK